MSNRPALCTTLLLAALASAPGCGPDHPLNLDNDGDGFCERVPCADGSAYGDCDDFDASVYPGADEICNGQDDNCDQELGEGESDTDLDGYLACQNDCNDADAAVHPGAPERCSGVDDDCDGSADPPGSIGCAVFYLDQDGDGYGRDDDWSCLCDAVSPYTAARRNDCDDAHASANPGAVERCNGIDDDCDGSVDEGFDADLDGAVACAIGSAPADCDDSDPALNRDDLDGDGSSTCDGDCDDTDPARNPRDDDGDGSATCPDEGAAPDCDDTDPALSAADADGDGFSSCDGDCDDTDPGRYPGALELCNGGVDDDCDPATDERADIDGDGHTSACGGDCDDTDPQVYPEAGDVFCDGTDSDCDGTTEWLVSADSGDGDTTWYRASIQEAIDDAVSGDVICVQPGTYMETIDFKGKEVSVVGVEGPERTIVDGGGEGPVVTLESGEGAGAVLEGITIRNGHAYQGGGLFLQATSPTLADLVVSSNRADRDGGGVYMGDRAAPLVADLRVLQNGAAGKGGGLYLDSCSPVIDGIEVTANEAGTDGGGAYLIDVGDAARIAGGSFTLNSAPSGHGGGLYLSNSSPLLEDLDVSYNTADYTSGLELVASNATLTRVIVADNLATQNYGGVYLHTSSATFVDVDITGNTAVVSQSGISLTSSAPTFRRVTVSRNTAANYAGVNLWSGSNALFEEVDISDNEATTNYCGVTASNSNPTFHFVTISGNTSHGAFGGGVRLASSSPSFTNVTVSGNVSPRTAGGIAVTNSSSPVFEAVIISGNQAGTTGGGISVSSTSAIDMTNVTIAGNTAGTYGGGVYLDTSSQSRMDNVVIAFNGAEVGGGGVSVSNNGQAPAITYCDLHGNVPDDGSGWSYPLGEEGNVSADPAFVSYDQSAPPADWDLSLSPNSSLIDAGNPDIEDPDGSRSDMGAYGGPCGAW